MFTQKAIKATQFELPKVARNSNYLKPLKTWLKLYIFVSKVP